VEASAFVSTTLQSIRRQLAVLCRRRGSRIVEWSEESPCDWRPRSVIDPSTSQPFNADGAWEYIADQFESGHPFEPVLLEKPPGRTGYVFTKLMPNGRTLYVKVQLLNGVVSGRSFHYSIHR
jgi:hypothetical protein